MSDTINKKQNNYTSYDQSGGNHSAKNEDNKINEVKYKDNSSVDELTTVENIIKRKNKLLNKSDDSNKNKEKDQTYKRNNSSPKQEKQGVSGQLASKIYDKFFATKEEKKGEPSPKIEAKFSNENHENPKKKIFVDTTRDLLGLEDVSVQDKIAPSSLEVDFNDIKVNNTYVRTIFVIDYKRSSPGMLESLINYDRPIDISMYYYPIDTTEIVSKIRKKIAELEAALNLDLEAGKVPNAYIKVALQDALQQQDALASGAEKYFHFGLYITIKSKSKSELENLTNIVISDLNSKEMTSKTPTLKMEQAFKSSLPYAHDVVKNTRNMDTTSIAMTFPFTSSDLSQEKGVLYGINTYNNGLVVFDRFSMPNANMVVLASTGGGKSYFVKLEVLRSLMLGTECIIIDPENEYEDMTKMINGSYISFSQDGKNKLNPFELPAGAESNEDELRLKELSLQGFFKIIFGGSLGVRTTAVLDRAIRMAYREKGITNDQSTFVNPPPRMEDLYKVLRAMDDKEAQEMAIRLERFLVGSASGIFDKKTNIEINNKFTVFSIRDLSEELRPLAMYLMLDFIWTKIKRDKKRRILVIDEAWILMKYPDSALFINSIAKRARKYYLGLTTITQDVQDFLSTDYGKAVVTNSSIQVLFRQSPTGADYLGSVFDLSEGEKAFLLTVQPGTGLFFAGNNHVSINVKASDIENEVITTNPAELEKRDQETQSSGEL